MDEAQEHGDDVQRDMIEEKFHHEKMMQREKRKGNMGMARVGAMMKVIEDEQEEVGYH